MSTKFQVSQLISKTDEYIIEHHKEVIDNFISHYQDHSNYPIDLYEKYISKHLFDHIMNEKLLEFKISSLDRILNYHFSYKNDHSIDEYHIINDFLFKCFEKYREEALFLFKYIDLKDESFEYIKHQLEDYFYLFDYSKMNSTLFKIIFNAQNNLFEKQKEMKEEISQLKEENKNIKISFNKKIDDIFNDLKAVINDFKFDQLQIFEKKTNNMKNDLQNVDQQNKAYINDNKTNFIKFKNEQININQQNEMIFSNMRQEMQKICHKNESDLIEFKNIQQTINQRNESSINSIISNIQSKINENNNSIKLIIDKLMLEHQKTNTQNGSLFNELKESGNFISNKIDNFKEKQQKINQENFDKNDSLYSSINEIKNEINQINQSKDDILKQIKQDILELKLNLNDKSGIQYDLIVPITEKDWNKVSSNEFNITIHNIKYTVISSSIWRNQDDHAPYYLFNGKNESQGGLRWASDESNSAYIIIGFNIPKKANLLQMRARNDWFCQAPTSFAIFCGENTSSFKKIKEFANIHWSQNEEKEFFFKNCKEHYWYKVEFYSSLHEHYNFALAELNLAEIK